MKIDLAPGELRLCEIGDLEADCAPEFIERVTIALGSRPGRIEIDLSSTHKLDAVGLSALAEIHRRAFEQDETVSIRVLHAPPPVRHLMELGRLHHVFEMPAA